MPRSLTKIHLKAINNKAEEPTPNATKAFFKTANDWIHLSGYAGQFSSPNETIQKPSKILSYSRRSIEVSQEEHEERVETAINYLILRDLGCTRENAMSLTSRKRPDNGSFVKSLPTCLRRDFSMRIKRNKCLPCRPPSTYENFDSISQAFKDLIVKQQIFIDPPSSNYQKRVEELGSRKKEVRVNYETMKRQETKLKINRVVVPEIKTLPKVLDLTPNLTSVQSPESLPKIFKSQEASDLPAFPHELQIKPGRSHKISINSLSNGNKSTSTKSDLVPGPSKSSAGHSEYLSPEFLKSPKTRESSVSGFEIKVQSEASSESSEVDYPKLVGEDKRLINLIRLQKYRQAQMKGEENKKSLQKIRQRKKVQDLKNYEERLKKFEKKKEKIFMAKLKKENLMGKKKECNAKKLLN